MRVLKCLVVMLVMLVAIVIVAPIMTAEATVQDNLIIAANQNVPGNCSAQMAAIEINPIASASIVVTNLIILDINAITASATGQNNILVEEKSGAGSVYAEKKSGVATGLKMPLTNSAIITTSFKNLYFDQAGKCQITRKELTVRQTAAPVAIVYIGNSAADANINFEYSHQTTALTRSVS